MRADYLTAALGAVLLASGGPPAAPTDELVRRANAAFLRGDAAAAGPLYAAAAERTADPGLVAFNAAAVLFSDGNFREAERHYRRVLADRDCPPDRRARALYNRGVCLVRRDGDADTLRAAVGSFAACVDANPADPGLLADARHNLELAKLLWAEARQKSGKSAAPPDQSADAPPPPPKQEPGNDPAADPNSTNRPPSPAARQQPGKPTDTPTPTDVKAPAAGSAGVLDDSAVVQPLTADDAREQLRRAADRLTAERRRTLELLYGPDKPGVRDW